MNNDTAAVCQCRPVYPSQLVRTINKAIALAALEDARQPTLVLLQALHEARRMAEKV